MKRVKGREPVTFSISPDVLAVVDAHAQAIGMDRYDVIRLAIAKGMMVLRVEHELLMDESGRYAQALAGALTGDDQAQVEQHRKVLEASITSGLERDVPGGPSKLKRSRKVRDDGL